MKRSGFQIMARLVGLVMPLTGYMILAVVMGLIGHLCAAFITVFGGYGIVNVLHARPTALLFSAVLIFALVRGFLRYAKQACNHFIAFKLLALIRDQVFGALRRLRLAKLDATDEEIIAACKKASVHDFIMSLPKGYDTEVGELGDTLSGGERQRLGLARAFLHDAPFMLLDEPTSNLDSLNEAVILKALHEECADKTVVLVSHRKSTMGIADTVYSVEHGRMS